jgi:hypothetical protein
MTDVFALSRVTCRPVTPARWPDLEQLFGERGACGGCWCMVWRLSRQRWRYPVGPVMARTPDAFVWTGIPSAFREAGFKEALRRSRTRPIMRFEIEGRP